MLSASNAPSPLPTTAPLLASNTRLMPQETILPSPRGVASDKDRSERRVEKAGLRRRFPHSGCLVCTVSKCANLLRHTSPLFRSTASRGFHCSLVFSSAYIVTCCQRHRTWVRSVLLSVCSLSNTLRKHLDNLEMTPVVLILFPLVIA